MMTVVAANSARVGARFDPPIDRLDWRSAGLRYYKYSHFLRQRFGGRVHRVSVDGHFTCPNVDGTVAVGGCVYCDNRSFSPARRAPGIPIARQVSNGIAQLARRTRAERFLAYFQSATNTYAPVAYLRQLYDEALSHPQVVGLIVGTRPDCVPDPVLDLLQSYTDRWFVALEYGLQSVHRRSLEWMNRGHDVACFFDAVARTRGRRIDTSAHVILGLPGESGADVLATADALADADVDGVKIHNLHVVRHTPLEGQFRRGQVRILERGAYLDVLIAFLERLPGAIVVHRVTGDAPPDYLIAPAWVRHKAAFLQKLDQELLRRDTWQGKHARAN